MAKVDMSNPSTTEVDHDLFSKETQLSLQDLRPLEIAGIITKQLMKAGIPSVVWGTLALAYYKVPTAILEVALVVPDHLFNSATSLISTASRRCFCQDEPKSSNPCHSFLVPAPPAHWLITTRFGIDLWKQSSVFWRLQIFPNTSDLVLEQATIAATGLQCTVYYPRLHKLVESYVLLAMRDYGTKHSSSRSYPILYIQQYTDPALQACRELGDGEEARLIKEAYEGDDMSEALKRGHDKLFS